MAARDGDFTSSLGLVIGVLPCFAGVLSLHGSGVARCLPRFGTGLCGAARASFSSRARRSGLGPPTRGSSDPVVGPSGPGLSMTAPFLEPGQPEQLVLAPADLPAELHRVQGLVLLGEASL